MILNGILERVLMNEAGGEQAVGGGGGGEQSPTQQPAPNENWQNDANLDSNGNPIEPKPPAQEKPPTEEKPNADDKPDTSDKGKEGDTPPEADEPIVDLSAPVVTQLENLVTEAGLDSSEVALAVTDNGGEVTPAILKALIDKHGESVAGLIANQLNTLHKSNVAKSAQKDQKVYDQVADAFKDVTDQSGKETFKELAGWAKENVSNEDRKEINKLLAQGGLAATYAINDLVNRFKSSQEFTQEAQLTSGDSVSTEFGEPPLGKADYTRELRALEEKGHIYGQSQEMAKLDRRREAGIARGMR